MERSKGLILIVVGLAAALIIWQVGFNKPAPVTPNQNNTNEQRQQANQENAAQNPAANNRIPATAPDQNARNMNQANNSTRTRNNQPTTIQNTGLKIAIPEKISTADLQVIYNEYRQMGGGGRTNRGGRSSGRGGMMGGGGGFGGMMGGGQMDPTMMNGMGADMGGMMGGFGGGMGGPGGRGGFGGGMDMSGMMGNGAMDTGGNSDTNPDDTENMQ